MKDKNCYGWRSQMGANPSQPQSLIVGGLGNITTFLLYYNCNYADLLCTESMSAE